MFYSKSKNGFYDKSIHGNNMPKDVVEIPAEYYAELLNGQSGDKVIEGDDKGYPRLIDPPTPSPEQLQAARNSQARAYLANTDWYVVRFTETGTPIPDDIRAAREAARASVVE